MGKQHKQWQILFWGAPKSLQIVTTAMKLKDTCYLSFPYGSAGNESTCNRPGLIPGLGRSPGEGKGYPLQYSALENSMDCIVHGVAKSQTWLSDFHSLTHLLLGRKAMTNLKSILKIRDITLQTNVCIVKAMVFPVVMYRCDHWIIKKAEH